jgi:hypothetical protein
VTDMDLYTEQMQRVATSRRDSLLPEIAAVVIQCEWATLRVVASLGMQIVAIVMVRVVELKQRRQALNEGWEVREGIRGTEELECLCCCQSKR